MTVAVNAIVVSVSLQMTNGFDSYQRNVSGQLLDQNAPGKVSKNILVGTSEQLLDLSELTTAGVYLLRNLDDTNFVEVGLKPVATFLPLVKLKAGMCSVGGLSIKAGIYLKADTDPVWLEVVVLED